MKYLNQEVGWDVTHLKPSAAQLSIDFLSVLKQKNCFVFVIILGSINSNSRQVLASILNIRCFYKETQLEKKELKLRSLSIIVFLFYISSWLWNFCVTFIVQRMEFNKQISYFILFSNVLFFSCFGNRIIRLLSYFRSCYEFFFFHHVRLLDVIHC